ncbi:ankyrin repeat-containing protein, partial [Tanacetum coccineum]
MVLNRRHERMVTLLSKNSPPDTPREKFMDVKLYEAAKKGDIDSFLDALVKVSQANNSLSLRTISEQRTRSKNTCLHVAASHGNKDLTGFIVFYFRNLLFMTNSEGNTAIHEAARAGHLGVVKTLVRFKNYDEQMYSAKECDTTE